MARHRIDEPHADLPDPLGPRQTRARAQHPDDYQAVRNRSRELCDPLDPEDLGAQSMPDTSPGKWHLAHTTWFFETFVLAPFASGHQCHDESWGYLFNSYYNGVGDRHARPDRGLLTRPNLGAVLEYRAVVDDAMRRLLADEAHPKRDQVQRVTEIGLHHEQQHQELILTDLKHLFAQNALCPAYRAPLEAGSEPSTPLHWLEHAEGLYEIGHAGDGFCFDNETPRHRCFVEAFALADRLVTNGEWREFIDDGGYTRPDLWLDRGWATVQREGWQHPLYWRKREEGFAEFTLAGERALCDAEPVCHISFVEADAFARWAGARLPTEFEWEITARDAPVEGNFVESDRLHPRAAAPSAVGPRQIYGDVWEWTRSSYAPYPGYRPEEGALGEYNGKFMCDQMVLRGGSCFSPRSHLRASYRNFFYPPDRWQLTGVRLAREA